MVQTWEEGPQQQFIQIVEKTSENVRKEQMTNISKRLMFDYACKSILFSLTVFPTNTLRYQARTYLCP